MTLAEPQAPLPPDGGTQTGTDTSTNAGTDTGTAQDATPRKEHAKPIFDLQPVGHTLPVISRAASPLVGGMTREQRFKGDLEKIKADPGTWYVLADYGATTTARRTARYLEQAVKPASTKTREDGTTEQIGGELLDLVADGAGNYQFVGQRSDTDAKRSKLYARYVTPEILANEAAASGTTEG